MHFDLSELKNDIENEKFIAKKILTGDKNEFIYLELKSFQKIEKHSVEYNTIFFVLEGEGLFIENEETINIGKNSIIKSKANVPHEVVNTKETPLKIIVNKYKD